MQPNKMCADEDWVGQRLPLAKGGLGAVGHSMVIGT